MNGGIAAGKARRPGEVAEGLETACPKRRGDTPGPGIERNRAALP